MANILIVDDRNWIPDSAIRERLGRNHHVITTAEPGSVWEEILRNQVDLVVLNLSLNGAYGWDVLLNIKMKAPRLPVVLAACDSRCEDDARLFLADGYIFDAKPSITEIGSSIHNALNRTGRNLGPARPPDSFPPFSSRRTYAEA